MTWMVFRRWWCQSVDSHSTNLPHPFNNEASTVQCGTAGGEVLGQAANGRLEGGRVRQFWSLWHATNAVGSDILGVPSSTTTPNTIHLSAQPHHSMLILLGLGGNDLFQQTWKVIHCTRTCDLPQHFFRAAKLPISPNSR